MDRREQRKRYREENKEAIREAARVYHQKNKDVLNAKRRGRRDSAHTAARRRAWYTYLKDLKAEAPCEDCGAVHPPEIMDFDHVPERGPKIKAPGDFEAKTPKALAELAKCDVVCPTCHRYRTVLRTLCSSE